MTNQFPKLSEQVIIPREDADDLVLINPWVIQPIEYNMFVDGTASEQMLETYRRLARSGAGMMIVEASYVTPYGRGREPQLVIDEDHRDGIERILKAIKEEDENIVRCVQLSHSGDFTDRAFTKDGTLRRVHEPQDWDNITGELLTVGEIEGIRDAYIEAAEIAYNAGAQMVDIKACHGYLMQQLLRPANTRNDKYGGCLENRMGFIKEVLKGIKKAAPELAIMTRISVHEGNRDLEGALYTSKGEPMTGAFGAKGPGDNQYDAETVNWVLEQLTKYVNVFNVSAGNVIYALEDIQRKKKEIKPFFDPDHLNTALEYHHFQNALQVKNLMQGRNIPVIASGLSVFGEYMARVAELVLEEGMADMVGMGRQSMVNPNIYDIMRGTDSTGQETKYCVTCDDCLWVDLVGSLPVKCESYREKE